MAIETAVWIVVLAVGGGLLLWLIVALSKGQVMRCPETGAVSFVRVAHAPGGKREMPEVVVRQCNLWPARRGCAQGCLARYWETANGLQVNLDALRPFDPHWHLGQRE